MRTKNELAENAKILISKIEISIMKENYSEAKTLVEDVNEVLNELNKINIK